MNKKKIAVIGGCVLILGITVGGITAVASRKDIHLEEFQENIVADKDKSYSEYLANTISSTLKENYGIADCEMDINCSNGEVLSANVKVAVEDKTGNDLETEIMDYLSTSLGISAKNIGISFY